MRVRTLAPTVVAMAALAAGADAPSPLAKKYEDRIRLMNWAWSDEEATLLWSIAQASSPYDLVVIKSAGPSVHPGWLKFKILDGRREVYAWEGTLYSLFILRDERLYFLRQSDDGRSALVGVDLKTGKEIWDSPLRQMGYVPRGVFWKGNMLRANGETISVWTKLSEGGHFELKDAKTGETVGHKVFDGPADGRR